MSWLDEMRPGMYAGIPCQVVRHQMTGGRRGVHHEYPGGDTGEVETFGLADKKFKLDLVLFEDDFTARNAMAVALDEAGRHELVHPWFGTMSVEVDPTERWSLSESVLEGRKSVFTVTFIKTGKIAYPTARTDTRLATLNATDTARAVVLQDFEKMFVTRGFPGFVAAATGDNVGTLLDRATEAASGLRLATDQINKFKSDAKAIRDKVGSLVYQPASLGQAVQSLLTFGQSTIANPLPSLDALTFLQGWPETLDPVPNSSGTLATASRVRQSANQKALVDLVGSTAALLKADAVATADFDSFDAAQAALRDTLNLLDVAAEGASDPVFIALEDARSKLVTDIRTRAVDLARLVVIELPRTQPALKVAYELFEDLAKADDLIARNRLKHPNFVPAGVGLEVLSNV